MPEEEPSSEVKEETSEAIVVILPRPPLSCALSTAGGKEQGGESQQLSYKLKCGDTFHINNMLATP